ncbi:ABC transporter ATP-binding protein [Enterococcus cecorum]|uniref:ABC transporter ATP-binding protein n=1 Tax=Enterococcus cecorum TaxID=44008 RepID=UPI000643BD73|nr:ABC transporter ATP-binding protein [Enterococcus cecorum]KLO73902.1 ABC transporter ATP-binding protein [Enterococcus cecorum]MCJ0521797.1 ABC transporter ATP-binding protein [Enterococcus cecorum]MCJ0558992.1 ABC transporter ATP-binding protein [Enterococcus cecorum]MCJ0599331.1 ABC transporter ATP-binding protein [Enterococcus cecorum]MCJ0603051.1 ABC transporter ATP-binding protein [Enterococcus cecorum]
MFLEIHDLNLFFDEKQILAIDEIQIEKGELVTLLGPSGCGKSTLLRCITGLEQPKSGEIVLDNENIADKPTKDRNIGFVFQQYALFPTMTVFENVAFGLKVKKLSPEVIKEKVFEMLSLVDMTEQADKNVQLLSGGQRQRVALARSLVTEPKVLLLDEPLSALDARIRKQLQRDLRAIQQSLGMTMIFVTHDQEEAMRISDRIFVMEAGRVAQVSTSKELYQNPQSRFVAEFIGNYNRFEWYELDQYTHEFSAKGNRCIYYLRPELIQFEPVPQGIKIPVLWKESFILGNIQRYVFQTLEGKEILVDRLNDREEKISDALYIQLKDILAIPVEIDTQHFAQQS